MRNEIQVFNNTEFGNIRTIQSEGQAWFVGKDVAKALGYERAVKAVQTHVDDEDKDVVPIRDSIGRMQNTPIINESGLYSLILSSKLPSAKVFKRWVTTEVLPCIRKMGGYITDELLERLNESEEEVSKFLAALTNERNERKAIERKCKSYRETIKYYEDCIEVILPKAEYCDIITGCDDDIPISIIAKDYGMTAAYFNKVLNTVGIQYKVRKTWLLSRLYHNKGYTVSKTFYIGENKSKIHTYWTPKGRKFIYDYLKLFDILPEVERTKR